MASILAAIGLYGVITYTVASRGHEIGIRMALGAKGSNILKLVLHQAVVVITIGLAAGLAGSLALNRLLGSMLWGVTPTDSMTFALVSLGLVTVALLACLVPTRRAMARDPAVVLREKAGES